MAKNQRTGGTPSSTAPTEANQIAKATQRPGQTKEQTKLIAQGIQKGIEQYKKQHKAKLREIDKRNKKSKPAPAAENDSVEVQTQIQTRQHPLPWILLLLSWAGFIAWQFLLG